MTKRSGPGLESGRAFSDYAKCFFQCEAGLADCTFFK